MKTEGYSPHSETTSGVEKESDFFNSLYRNPNIKNLPNHLKQYIVDQNYVAYAPIDHSVWRYVLRQSHRFLIDHAHEIYFEGLEKTGLKVEGIPSIEEMNEILARIGWAAVSVDGFIPPSAFMEFQAHRVLVIAADMRQIHHIEYTPSPDIIHEAAGHAPVIADAEYAEYLRKFGEVGSKAMSSKKDFELYEAIRKLSILKEARDVSQEEINKAEKDVLYKQKNLGKPSEMALLSRLHWWTVEYGLIGDLESPKIYGAGLLSSIGEASLCLSPKIKKIPYDINAKNYPFDITTMQPHLFVTPDFRHLIDVLEEFSSTMAYKVGGMEGLNKAIECKNTSTAVFSSGLQLSGTFAEVLRNEDGKPIYVRTEGKTNLSYKNKELSGHGVKIHADGFSTPVGRLRNFEKPLEDLTDSELMELGLRSDKVARLNFDSGLTISGKLKLYERKGNKIIVMSFDECTVRYKDTVLFEPSMGRYDLAVGEKIVSVFSGAADKDAYDQISRVSQRRVVKYTLDQKGVELNRLYQMLRDYRAGVIENPDMVSVWEILKNKYPHEWLLAVEIYEILTGGDDECGLKKEVKKYLLQLSEDKNEFEKLITDGIFLAENPTKYKNTWKN